MKKTGFLFLVMLAGRVAAVAQTMPEKLRISGVYPHLAVFNDHSKTPKADDGTIAYKNAYGDGGECGIGAIVPWAGKLWMVTYSPHKPQGSSDKLYSITPDLVQTIHPESIGGTPANRMIHKESDQLIISNYFIDKKGGIRTIPFSTMPGRMTATARHLTDPADKVYFYDMEGMLYEVNVHDLAVNKLFHKPVPGWHGKGAYTSQGLLVIANNGEEAVFKLDPAALKAGTLPKNKEEMGALASWDGTGWKIVERKQFTDVTGPGGIYGAPDDKSPLWSIGWDRRSVILKLLDGGQWYTYRLPKATHTYDHRGGWYTEWPRIREVGNGKMLMDMHGMFYDFPKTFSCANSAGIRPVSTHLRYIPDFCSWNGKLVLSTDETTILENPMAGRAVSNLWFGSFDELKEWGTPNAWGGPWVNDTVKAGMPSDAFLVNGREGKVLHLVHKAPTPVTFTIEVDKAGNNHWQIYKTITVGAGGYGYFIFPESFSANWVRFKTDKNCVASAYLYFNGRPNHTAIADPVFAALAGAADKAPFNASYIRPAGHNTNLQVLPFIHAKATYREVNEKLEYLKPAADSTVQMNRLMPVKKDFDTDAASVIVTDKTGTFRLPKGDAAYDQPFAGQWPRGRRELESERLMLNAHGSFYEIGREAGYKAMRPVTTHNKKIMDFCTWRGLLVLSGTKANAAPDGHYFSDGANGLWFGAIDDLWKLGKPRGEGGVWKNSDVKAGKPSLPYLMTGYDKKTVTLSADKTVTITLEVDVDLNGWQTYQQIKVPAGKTIMHRFPSGYSAHWIRAVADRDCKATVWLKYE
ncbi:hypothetical protein [Niabella beijingensis]|uniref:hypothetical protein n=1 Tax=Niabella beijingensis TaxID=2872700 RepID=UPI001CBAD3AF|nr:hypothetical protein [Niabella beijingensis]MBZ4192169.1 hypothetical protein [Niabella beijingensis]